jgi:hypothetical protein
LRDKMRKNPASPAAFKKYKEALFASGEELIALASKAAQDSAPAELPPLPGCLADRLYEAISIAHHRAEHAGSVPRMKKWDATAADLRAALAAAPASPQPVAKVLQVVRGELCYKSEEDDQSYGMWCPVTPEYAPPYPNGTEFYPILAASTPTTLTEKKE